ncbi:hypothetical protein C8R42DRAFT_717670 [Lentinula raphanica]|nr:hypothetical protein C8R42DRAFT_717670 [Lentinula raphanica]
METQPTSTDEHDPTSLTWQTNSASSPATQADSTSASAPRANSIHHRRSLSWDENLMEMDMARSQSTIPETQVTAHSMDSSITSNPAFSTPAPKKRPAPASATSFSSKRVKSTNLHADAVNSLSSALNRFGDNFVEGANTLAAALNGSPSRNACTKET